MANKSSRSHSGSLAGWLFADLAIVLAIVFLSSSIGSDDVLDDDVVSATTAATTTTTTAQPQSLGTGVSINPCQIKFLRITNPSNNENIKLKLISEIKNQTKCLASDFYGVVLIFAGNADTDNDEDARARADALCESLFQTWDAMNRSFTYCQGYKNDSIDSTYFDLTLFPYVPKP